MSILETHEREVMSNMETPPAMMKPVNMTAVDSAMYKVRMVLLSVSDNIASEGLPAPHELRIWELLLEQAYNELHKA
jgi:hypothetical protein